MCLQPLVVLLLASYLCTCTESSAKGPMDPPYRCLELSCAQLPSVLLLWKVCQPLFPRFEPLLLPQQDTNALLRVPSGAGLEIACGQKGRVIIGAPPQSIFPGGAQSVPPAARVLVADGTAYFSWPEAEVLLCKVKSSYRRCCPHSEFLPGIWGSFGRTEVEKVLGLGGVALSLVVSPEQEGPHVSTFPSLRFETGLLSFPSPLQSHSRQQPPRSCQVANSIVLLPCWTSSAVSHCF